MKIALNIEWIGARRGGAEKYAGMVARGLLAAGHEVHLFARGVDDGEVPQHVPIHEIPVFLFPGFSWLRTYRFAQLSARVLKRQAFDLVIGFNKTWHQDVYLAVAGSGIASNLYSADRFRSPLQRAWHRAGKWLSPKQWLFRRIERKQFGDRRPHVVACSHFSARHFMQFHGVPEARLSVVYNGLNVDRRTLDRADARQKFRRDHGLADDAVAVLFSAHNYALKGLEPLLEAFARVASANSRAVLCVCGSDDDAEYRRTAARLGIADRVRFLGFVDDVHAPFAGCDLFAFPSFYDPCSLVVPEALYAGLPVITSGSNGASELIVEGETGFVVDDNWNIDRWVDCLQFLISDDELRARMSARARRDAAGMTLEVRLRELAEVLKKTARKPAARPPTRRAA